ncbi:MAG: UDP-N-acetylmuramate--L-alanine ligase [Candidatus Cloacimonetes bacterium]|nr:UDP-N-acetylmuramate--L-alanine ligase [Candidatus Cloacimonadota bacterium]
MGMSGDLVMMDKSAGQTKKFHFIGIGGSGMSGVAQICLDEGYRVSGSDLKKTEVTERLQTRGAVIHFPHSEKNVTEEPVVVISSAIPEANEELAFARQKGLVVKKRAELLGWFMSSRQGISVAGCHGKTTTTSMVSAILTEAGLDPTTVVGGESSHVGGNAKFGKGEFLVAEADESDGSFLYLPSTYSIVTNVDNDHLDYYGTIQKVEEAFACFLHKTRNCAMVCADDTFLAGLWRKNPDKIVGYGVHEEADYRIVNVTFTDFGSEFEVHFQKQPLTSVRLNVPGMHNVLNATAALGLSHKLGVCPEVAARALTKFVGVQRRFELVADRDGVLAIDDYAHHPTEIVATLKAARRLADSRKGQLVVAFQPHRFSRLKHLIDDFASSFLLADYLYLMPVYSAGERSGGTLDSWALYRKLKNEKHRVELVKDCDYEKHAPRIFSELRGNDVFLTLGAGDVTKLGRMMSRKEYR